MISEGSGAVPCFSAGFLAEDLSAGFWLAVSSSPMTRAAGAVARGTAGADLGVALLSERALLVLTAVPSAPARPDGATLPSVFGAAGNAPLGWNPPVMSVGTGARVALSTILSSPVSTRGSRGTDGAVSLWDRVVSLRIGLRRPAPKMYPVMRMPVASRRA